MDNLTCPSCGLINNTESKQCICGYIFEKEGNRNFLSQQQILESNIQKINYFKRNQVGIIVFSVLVGLYFILRLQANTNGTEGVISVFLQTIIDSPIALGLAALSQWISNKIKKNKHNAY